MARELWEKGEEKNEMRRKIKWNEQVRMIKAVRIERGKMG